MKWRLPAANLLRSTELDIWIMLSTYCRVVQLSQARREHLDLEQVESHIPAGNSNNAKDHTFHL